MKIVISVATVFVVIVVGFLAFNNYFYNEKQDGETQQNEEATQLSSNEIKDESNVPINPTANWSNYTDSRISLSFKHPSEWSCNTRRVHIDYPDWLQTFCLNETTGGNPYLALSTPYIDSGEFELFTITETESFIVNGLDVTKTIYRSSIANSEFGTVYYQSGNSESVDSFSLSLPFGGVASQHTNSFEAEKIGNLILDSINY